MVNYYGFVGFLPILHQSYSVYRGNMNFKLSKLKRLAENRYCVRREGSNQLLASFKGPIENAEAALENERSFIEFFGRRPAPLTRKVRFDELAAWREIESDPETLNAYRMAAGFVDRATAAHDIKIEKLAAWSAQLAQLSERLGSLYRSNFQRKVSHLRLVQCVEMEEAMIELSRYVSLVNQASLAKLTESIVNE